MSTSTYYAKDFAPKIPNEAFIRSSCPAVLEGLSHEQLDVLNSINPESNYNYSFDSDSYDNYSIGYPPMPNTNSPFNSFNSLPVTQSSSSPNSNYEFIPQQQREYYESHQESPPNLAPFAHYDNNQNQSYNSPNSNFEHSNSEPSITNINNQNQLYNPTNSNFEHFYPETRHTTLPPPIKIDYEMNQLPTLYQDLRNTRNSMNYKVIAPQSSNSTTP